MLQELTLSNFRIFGEKVSIRFRPITILIGRNSSGKSSIIKFFLMLQQSVSGSSSQYLVPEGDVVQLGPFATLRNVLMEDRDLRFSLGLTLPETHRETLLIDHLSLPGEVDLDALRYGISSRLRFSGTGSPGRTDYSISHPSFSDALLTIRERVKQGSHFLAMPELREKQRAPLERPDGTGPTADRKALRRTQRDTLRYMEKVLKPYMADLSLRSMLRHEFTSIRHLSRVRDESPRVMSIAAAPTGNVGTRGQHALAHLRQQMSNNAEARALVAGYLAKVGGIEDVRFVRRAGDVTQVYATSVATGAEVMIADYGFGVSQCLPIFVQGALMSPYSTFMVEQPEAQLHPTAQLEMGSFFADLWKQRQVASIIETHSDNILLRIRRLIAKGTLSSDEVSVAYFATDQEQGGVATVQNLDIHKDGSMEEGLPFEFFGADISEGLQLGAGE